MRRLVFLLVLLLAPPAFAVEPDEMLDDPALEQRARDLSAEIRCVVCQNQSIDESDADLARDLRLLVRERIEAGDSDAEVIAYVVERYGEFVLLKPRFEGEGIILWLAPLLMIAAGATLVVAFLSGRDERLTAAPVPLSEEEQAELDRLLKDSQEAGPSEPRR